MPKTSWERMARIAGRHHALFTATQARAEGVHPTTLAGWVRTGRVERWYDGVYALTGVADSWLRRARAATLAVPAAVVCGLAAAFLHGLLDCERADVVLLAPRGDKHDPKKVRVRTTLALPDHHRAEIDGIPVTSVARTIVDLAAEVTRQRLADVLYDAWRRGLTTPLEVATCLGEVGRVRGAAKLRRVLEGADPALARTRSVAEIAGFLAIRDAGLPVPVVNHRVEAAGRRYELDYAWPESAKALEVDGKAWHSIAPDVAADEARQADLEAAGWDIDRAPASLVFTDPDAFVAQVRAHLGAPATSMSRSARS